MDGTTPSVSSVSDGSNPGISIMDGYPGMRGDLNGLQAWTGTLPQSPQSSIPATQLIADLAPEIRATETALTRAGGNPTNSRVTIDMSAVQSLGTNLTGGDPNATAALQTLTTEIADGAQPVSETRQQRKPGISGPKLGMDLGSGPKFSMDG